LKKIKSFFVFLQIFEFFELLMNLANYFNNKFKNIAKCSIFDNNFVLFLCYNDKIVTRIYENIIRI
jgi:hypothetical protein